jgi:hypothetical protein
MIPEGVLSPVPGGFRLFLQSNFVNRPGTKVRQRFTFAHELAHTFFYDVKNPTPKLIRGTPKAPKLEHLCHVAANHLLVPEPLLRRTLATTGEVASADAIVNLAQLFDVSIEVLMRRLHELRLIADEKFAAILVSTYGRKRVIQAACYGPVLYSVTSRPERGMDYDRWVSTLLSNDKTSEGSGWMHTSPTMAVKVTKIVRSQHTFLLDLRFEPKVFGIS